MRIASLGSGSRGNGTLIAAAGRILLVDCGFSLADAQQRAARLGVDLARLDAILVTHEHSDHCSGVAALSRRHGIPVYLTHGTLASGRLDGCAETHAFNADSAFSLGGVSVRAVAVPHDAREPVQYVFRDERWCAGVLTDLGSVTPHVAAAFAACDLLLLEFNHDRAMLAAGPYPPALKRRVGGDWGHLSNGQAADLLERLDRARLRRLFIAHTSEKNNTRGHIETLLQARFPDLLPRLVWACQARGFPWFCAERDAPLHAEDAAALVPPGQVGAY